MMVQPHFGVFMLKIQNCYGVSVLLVQICEMFPRSTCPCRHLMHQQWLMSAGEVTVAAAHPIARVIGIDILVSSLTRSCDAPVTLLFNVHSQ